MKIAVCIFTAQEFSSINDYCGGEYRYLMQIAKALNEMNHEVTVILESEREEFIDEGVRFIKYPRTIHSQHKNIGNGWDNSMDMFGCEPLAENDIINFDIFFAQKSDYMISHIFRQNAKNVIFCLGNPSDFDFDKSDCILTYDPVVSYSCLGNKLNTEVIYPYVQDIDDYTKKQNKDILISASTELYPYIAFDINYEIFIRAKKEISSLIYKHYYVPNWIDVQINQDPNEEVIEYFRKYDILNKLKNPVSGFEPTEFKNYREYQIDLVNSGFYLHGRGDIKALAGNEAMFHGVCLINPKKPHMTAADFAINIDFDYNKEEEREVAISFATSQLIDLYQNANLYEHTVKMQMSQTKPFRTESYFKLKLEKLVNELGFDS